MEPAPDSPAPWVLEQEEEAERDGISLRRMFADETLGPDLLGGLLALGLAAFAFSRFLADPTVRGLALAGAGVLALAYGLRRLQAVDCAVHTDPKCPSCREDHERWRAGGSP